MDKVQIKPDPNYIIDQLGGTLAVANLFGITTGGVSQWRTDGIPDARMFSIKLIRPDLFEKAA